MYIGGPTTPSPVNDSPTRLSLLPSTPSRRRTTASASAAATISPPESTKFPKDTASVESPAHTRSSTPPYLPQTTVRSGPEETSSTYPWAIGRPAGSVSTTRRASLTSRAGTP